LALFWPLGFRAAQRPRRNSFLGVRNSTARSRHRRNRGRTINAALIGKWIASNGG
jgi:hypothetical protein